MERSGVRRTLFKAQAEAGDIVLLFGDESEALTHPYLAHAWAKKGADLRIPAPGQAAKVALLGVLEWAPGTLVVHTSRTKRSNDFIALLEDLDRRYGPQPGSDCKPVGARARPRPDSYEQGEPRRLGRTGTWVIIGVGCRNSPGTD